MSTRPTYRESECKVKGLETERETFQEAIFAVSHSYYEIGTHYYKILKANAEAIEHYGGHFNQHVCYSCTHKCSTSYAGKEQPSP